MSNEAEARKQRSIAILKKENVPYIEHLPLIETESESLRRTTEEVALRAIALNFVAVKGEGLEHEVVNNLIKEFKIETELSPDEKKFIDDPNPSEHDKIQFCWRYECYWVMLWALGFIDQLGYPDQVCDVEKAVLILKDNGRDNFLRKAELRPQIEILDQADLYYRYHWATRQAELDRQEAPANLNGGVVMERHYALNWLIGLEQADWDDVSTDT